jgi:mono/diheme cytochrome c family protein
MYALSVAGVIYAQMAQETRRVELPDGEGKGLILGTCKQCHNLNPIVLQRKTAAGWEHTVHDMVARGAQVQVEEIPVIIDYLSNHFGPDAGYPSAVSAAVSSSGGARASNELPEGEAKAVILRACTQCHPIDRVTGNRKDEIGWQGSVKDMMRLGAKLEPRDVQMVVAYLVKNYGPAPSAVTAPASQTGVKGPAVAPVPPSLPEGEGKQLVMAACVQCHNLRYVTGQRKTAEGWRHTVQDMVTRGAQLTAPETELMAAYLAQHFALVRTGQ